MLGKFKHGQVVNIEKIFTNTKKPVLAIIGGAKVSTKLNILKKLLYKVDTIIIGGGIANTFLLSKNYSIGKSLAEIDMIDDAKDILSLAEKNNVSIPFPKDVVCDDSNNISNKDINNLSKKDMIKDIGPKT